MSAAVALPKGSRLEAIYGSLEAGERAALLAHLLGGTSAEWLAQTLTECGHPIGRSSIKRTRQKLKEGGVQL